VPFALACTLINLFKNVYAYTNALYITLIQGHVYLHAVYIIIPETSPFAEGLIEVMREGWQTGLPNMCAEWPVGPPV
jgi:hypothetical protein